MPRYKLTIEYDGRPFVGWQRQSNGLSIQQCLEEAVQGFAGEAVTVHGAGRTDAGVHATGQVAHIDLGRPFPADTVRDAINAHLRPVPVAVLRVVPASDAFEARFSAVERRYRYRIVNRRAPLTVDRGLAWHVRYPLDVAAMAGAAAALEGRHDFTSFRAKECQAKSPVKTLDELDVRPAGAEIVVTARARSFLHHQVRTMVGTLVEIGRGRRPPDAIPAILAARDRAAAGPTCPPDGLTLTRGGYPEELA